MSTYRDNCQADVALRNSETTISVDLPCNSRSIDRQGNRYCCPLISETSAAVTLIFFLSRIFAHCIYIQR